MTECCENCRYNYSDYCRRFPPIFYPIDGVSSYPITDRKSWCGEYQRKPDPNTEISDRVTFTSPTGVM